MPEKPDIPKARRLPLLLAAPAMAVLIAFAGSAFSPSGSSNAARSGVDLNRTRSQISDAPQAPAAAHGDVVQSPDPISTTDPTPSVARHPTGAANDEIGGTGAHPVDPCGLVSRDSAGAILGGPVNISQEPLGPTCMYSARGSELQLTLVVESTSLASLRRHARRASPVEPAGHPGWCLLYESTAVAVPLAGGRVLHVTGPCDTAARLAAEALPHVPR
ncbi:MAG TPA: DUF3558 family protein [Solirubrobacterales bacterium]|jgi:hypothetical protein